MSTSDERGLKYELGQLGSHIVFSLEAMSEEFRGWLAKRTDYLYEGAMKIRVVAWTFTHFNENDLYLEIQKPISISAATRSFPSPEKAAEALFAYRAALTACVDAFQKRPIVDAVQPHVPPTLHFTIGTHRCVVTGAIYWQHPFFYKWCVENIPSDVDIPCTTDSFGWEFKRHQDKGIGLEIGPAFRAPCVFTFMATDAEEAGKLESNLRQTLKKLATAFQQYVQAGLPDAQPGVEIV